MNWRILYGFRNFLRSSLWVVRFIAIPFELVITRLNDPTTAVLAIDQLHRMLRMVGKQHLRIDELLDQSGRLCVVFRTPNWEDLALARIADSQGLGGRSGNGAGSVMRSADLWRTRLSHRTQWIRIGLSSMWSGLLPFYGVG